MLFKVTINFDYCIINAPDSQLWSLSYRDTYCEDGCEYEDFHLHLLLGDEDIELRDAKFCSLADDDHLFPSKCEVGQLYEELINIIAERIAAVSDIRIIDIDSLEAELYVNKYKEKWSKRVTDS